MVIIGFIAGDEPDAPFMENVLAIADLAYITRTRRRGPLPIAARCRPKKENCR
jgi:hypothetical protein